MNGRSGVRPVVAQFLADLLNTVCWMALLYTYTDGGHIMFTLHTLLDIGFLMGTSTCAAGHYSQDMV